MTTKAQKPFKATPDLSRTEREAKQAADLQAIGKSAMACIAEMVAKLEAEHEHNESDVTQCDAAYEAIQQDALSVETRSGWDSPGAEMVAEEYRILLSTGGPATRIIGELDSHGEPKTARLEAQDWFQPWTEYRDADESVLLEYARCFYFGEG